MVPESSLLPRPLLLVPDWILARSGDLCMAPSRVDLEATDIRILAEIDQSMTTINHGKSALYVAILFMKWRTWAICFPNLAILNWPVRPRV